MKVAQLAGAGSIAVSEAVAPQPDDPWSTKAYPMPPSFGRVSWGELTAAHAAESLGHRGRSSVAARRIAEVGRPQDGTTLAAEMATMKAQIQELQEARSRDRRRIDKLLERVRSLEIEVVELMAEREDGVESVTNAHQRWIEQHLEVLREHTNRWVAIDAERGIVAEADDGEALADKLDALPPEEQARLVLVDTAKYV